MNVFLLMIFYENVEGAKKAGIEAYCFDGEVDKLRLFLEKNI